MACDDAQFAAVLSDTGRIANFGPSGRFESRGYAGAPCRKSKAYRGIPVNTMCAEILGARRYRSVSDIPESQRISQSVRGYQVFAPDMDCVQPRGDRR